MKKESYMNKNELIDFLKLGVLSGEAEQIAERTPVKEWAKKMRTASTYLSNIITERLKYLDKNQLMSVNRRKDHTSIMMLSSDKRRVDKSNRDEESNFEKEITVATEDLYDVVDMALLSCMKCPQGECVKGCRMRPVYHRLGVPPIRTSPNDGECEFRVDNEVVCVTPQYQKITERM